MAASRPQSVIPSIPGSNLEQNVRCGRRCVDSGFEPGFAGTNMKAYALLSLQRANIWPFNETYKAWDEEGVFTVIEFLYDHISKPQEKSYHGWNECGYHYSNFDKVGGQGEYRERMNVMLGRGRQK